MQIPTNNTSNHDRLVRLGEGHHALGRFHFEKAGIPEEPCAGCEGTGREPSNGRRKCRKCKGRKTQSPARNHAIRHGYFPFVTLRDVLSPGEAVRGTIEGLIAQDLKTPCLAVYHLDDSEIAAKPTDSDRAILSEPDSFHSLRDCLLPLNIDPAGDPEHDQECSHCGAVIESGGPDEEYSRHCRACRTIEGDQPLTRRLPKRRRRSNPSDYGLIRYPGGKKVLFDHIMPRLDAMFGELGDGTEYREPFFGAGAVGLKFLQPRPGRPAWLNDADPTLAAMWNEVLYDAPRLKMMIDLFSHVINAEYFYYLKRKLLAESVDPDERGWFAWAKIASHQISRSGYGTRSGGPMGGRDQRNPKGGVSSRYKPDLIGSKIDRARGILSAVCLRQDSVTCLDFEQLWGIVKSR